MTARYRIDRIRPAWWALILIVVIALFIALCAAFFRGTFRSSIPVTLTSDRAGLVMESGAKVKLRGVQVGRVAEVAGGDPSAVTLTLEIDPDQARYIPANVEAEIRSTTAFGAKYVDLITPSRPSPDRLAAGARLRSRNVSTEINTVFENLLAVLRQIDPAKLNAVVGAVAEGVRGRGEQMGQAITATNEVLTAVNPRMDTVRRDFQSLSGFSDTYGAAAQDILATLNAASTTSATVTEKASELDALLLNTIGFAQSGIDLIGPSQRDLIDSVNLLESTTSLLMKYNPVLTCLLVGGKNFLDNGGYEATGGGNGYSTILDAGVLWGNDQYRYPQHLPIVAAKGGPGGKPSCGSLPDAKNQYPVRYLVTNTGWGTGLDVRPNLGIGHPWWIDYFPVTRAVPEQPSVRGAGPPAIGPIPYPGAPPYGAPLYGPDGTPLYPGVPPPPTTSASPPAP